MADRRDNTAMERAQLRDGDVRNAMVEAARALDANAQKYRVGGYDWNLEDITYDVARIGEGKEALLTVVASLKIERAD
jgi:hypothetical protein